MEISTKAGNHLMDMLDRIDSPDEENLCFRITGSEESDLTLKLGTPASNDVALKHEDQTVLVIAPEALPLCENRILDLYEATERTKQLVLIDAP